jgi:hypothetical protein
VLRVRLPNRPGALGVVASALGGIGADINLVEIVEKRGAVEAQRISYRPDTDELDPAGASLGRLSRSRRRAGPPHSEPRGQSQGRL